jgi:hypothetical protein
MPRPLETSPLLGRRRAPTHTAHGPPPAQRQQQQGRPPAGSGESAPLRGRPASKRPPRSCRPPLLFSPTVFQPQQVLSRFAPPARSSASLQSAPLMAHARVPSDRSLPTTTLGVPPFRGPGCPLLLLGGPRTARPASGESSPIPDAAPRSPLRAGRTAAEFPPRTLSDPTLPFSVRLRDCLNYVF